MEGNNETVSYNSEDEDVEEEGQEGSYEIDDEQDNDTGELNIDSLDSFHDDFESAHSDFVVYLEEVEKEFEQSDDNVLAPVTDCAGYKIVGDNIDKNIRRTHQRIDRTTRSLHYFHMFAVKDRVDFSYLSDCKPTEVNVDIQVLLPGATDLAAIKKDFEILISR